jgi:DNA-binding transcriptional regulator YiaG
MAKKINSSVSQQAKEKPPIAAVIKELRETRGQSQSQFARDMNLSKDAITQWESGRREPNRWLEEKLYNMAVQSDRIDLAQRIQPRPVTAAETARKFLELEEDRSIEVSGGSSTMAQADLGRPSAPGRYDEDFKNLRTIIDSGQSQLIGEVEDVLSRVADLARNMTRKKKLRR